MKYIVCFSGGHSSALCAVECVKKHGKENVILLNHNLSSEVEDKDIKRFKEEIADYLGIKITYANMEGWEGKTPLRACRELDRNSYGFEISKDFYTKANEQMLRENNSKCEQLSIMEEVRQC